MIQGSHPNPGNDEHARQLVSDLYAYLGGSGATNYSPVFHRVISQHVGIRITGDFRTDDASEEGQISYVTVLRQSTANMGQTVVAADGLGICWRKQTGSVAEGNMQYNVYLVDNNAMDERVYIGREVVVETYGINSFLAAARVDIQPNTWYSFRMEINEFMGINCWIWETSAGEPVYTDPTRSVWLGISYPNYIPTSNGNHFGLAVQQTRGYQWWYRNIIISSLIHNYPAYLFRMYADPSKYTDNDVFTVTYRGIGYDPNNPADTGTRAYILTQPAQTWELIGSHTATRTDAARLQTLTASYDAMGDYRDGSDYVNIVVQPINTGLTHTLRSYYVSIAPYIPSGVHLGNYVDIYVSAPSRITMDTITLVAGESTRLEDVDGIGLPIQEVLSVTPTGVPLSWTRGQEWSIAQGSARLAWSLSASTNMQLSPTLISGLPLMVDVVYRYYQDGVLLQQLVSGQDYRYPGVHNLVKVYPPCVVNFESFTYRGGLAIDDMGRALAAHINSGITDNRLELSDLINVAYDSGATYVDTSTLSISLRKYDLDGTLNEIDFDNLYILSGENKFFTTLDEMPGLIRL